MHGGLPGLQLHQNGVVFVDVDHGFLPARQEVRFIKGVAMLQHVQFVGARHKAHAAMFTPGRPQGDPDRDEVVAGKSPVAQVLMPAHIGRTLRFLGKKGGAPDQNVGPDQFLNGVQNHWIAHQIVGEPEHDMPLTQLALVAESLADNLRLQAFQFRTMRHRLVRADHVKGRIITVAIEAFADAGTGVSHCSLGHGVSPVVLIDWKAALGLRQVMFLAFMNKLNLF